VIESKVKERARLYRAAHPAMEAASAMRDTADERTVSIHLDRTITGQFTSDPASGLATNAYTLEPRRYGLAAGFAF
jgi:hypothetical protein